MKTRRSGWAVLFAVAAATRLDRDAWVVDAAGVHYSANPMLSLDGGPGGSTDPGKNLAWQLEPGAEVDRHVVFTVPPGTRPARVHLVVPFDGETQPAAEWNL